MEICLKRNRILWNGVIFVLFTPVFVWAETALVREWPIFPTDWGIELFENPLATLKPLYFLISRSWRLQVFFGVACLGLIGTLMTVFFVYRAKKIAVQFFGLIALVTLSYSTWLMWRTNQKYLLIGILLYAFLSYEVNTFLKVELMRSYFRSKVPWWEGKPKNKYGVVATLTGPRDQRIQGFLTNLSYYGGYFFFENEQRELYPKTRVQLTFRDRIVHCSGEIMSLFRRGEGIGIAFNSANLDEEKDLKDFFSYLDREGYLLGE